MSKIMSGDTRNSISSNDAPGVGVASAQNGAVNAAAIKIVTIPHSPQGMNTSIISIPANPAFCDNYKCKECNATTKDDMIKCQTCDRLVHGACEGLIKKSTIS